MSRFRKRTRFLASILLALVPWLLAGCGRSEETVDPAPFEAAIATYLDQNNMGMAVKEVKKGPTISGDTATLTASLTRAVVGGPSVTWDFFFEKSPDGTWRAVRHQN